jgi:hypothetical protein
MSYRPHKRKRATRLDGKCIEKIGDNINTIFKPGILSVELRVKILAYLCESPTLVPLPEGFFDEGWKEVNLGGCVLPEGILSQIGREIQTLESLILKQCAGHEVLDHKGFAALCDGCREIRTMDMVGVMTFSDTHLACMHKLGSSLRHVRLGGCMCITPPALALFIQVSHAHVFASALMPCMAFCRSLWTMVVAIEATGASCEAAPNTRRSRGQDSTSTNWISPAARSTTRYAPLQARVRRCEHRFKIVRGGMEV